MKKIDICIERVEKKKIYRLTFDSNPLHDFGIEYLSDKFIQLSSLKYLSLNNIKLSDIGIHYLSMRLKYIPHLTFLSLSCIYVILNNIL